MLPPFGKGRINFEPSAMLTLPVVLLSVTLVKKTENDNYYSGDNIAGSSLIID